MSEIYTKTPSGLQYLDEVEGIGASPQPGQIVEVHYAGYLADGKKFDSSYDRQQPLRYTFGVNQVIQGWEEGLANMREGGKRKLIIPPALGYGSHGAGIIPPNAELHFTVELLKIG